MGTFRRVFVFIAIVALLALTISHPSDLLPFDLLAPLLLLITGIVVQRVHRAGAVHPRSTQFRNSIGLRAPPLQ